MKRFRCSWVFFVIAATSLLLIPVARIQAQSQTQAGTRKVLTIQDYGRWRSIASAALSEDGKWACYIYRLRDGESTLEVKQLDGDKIYKISIGTEPSGGRGGGIGAPAGGPQFSDDSRWIAYYVYVKAPERPGGRGGRGAVPAQSTAGQPAAAAAQELAITRRLELLELANGTKASWDNVASFAFSEGSRALIVKRNKLDRDAAHNGTDMIVRRLDQGIDELYGSTGEYSLDKSGTLLAFTIDAADMNGNGVALLDLAGGIRRTLDSDRTLYARLAWDEEGKALAVLKGIKKNGLVERENSLLAFRFTEGGKPERFEFKPADAADFPKDMVVSERAALSWSEDRNKIFFGIKEQEKEPERRREDAPPVANVDIWHWKDERIQSVQMIRANEDRNFTFRAAFLLGTRKFVRLTDDSMRTIQITRNGAWGVGRDDRAYISDWKEPQADYYRVDTSTGERTLMLRAQGQTFGLSPDSKHFLYWKDGHVWDYALETGRITNLTQRAGVSFVDQDYDHPGTKPSYGLAGYSKDGRGVILNHKYDLYFQSYDGSAAENLTGGVGTREEIRFRYQPLEGEGETTAPTRQFAGAGRRERERTIDLSQPLLLTAFGQWTKKAGFYELKGKELKKLIYEDKAFGGLIKAKDADRVLFTMETFVDFPDYYASDMTFANPKRITEANPWQSEYKWGRRILFEFNNKNGVRLQGTLAIPDDYQPGQKLPMLVNFYEKNSQNLHRYQAPGYASRPQFAGFVSEGYLVMQPDIHYNTRTSHRDMLDCVEAAVRKVIEMGYADPKRIGLHGHSYSGQGAAFIATQSKMFAAIVAGAAASDLVSDFNQLWKSSGTNQHRYDIYGQGRFGTNPYDDLQLYIDQSAVFHARTMNTPLLLLHGTDDGSVEWLQAVEFYNALRFNGKNVILLSYPGEAHGLRNLENQKDFLVRMQQFFDHYLKDKPAPEWMVKGVPFLKKAR